MAPIDRSISTYLTAIEIEGKTPRTIRSYSESLEDFRKLGRQLGLPEVLGEYDVAHVYEFLGALRRRGAAPGYQNRRHREVRAFFSWCLRMDMVESNVFSRVPLAKQEKKMRERQFSGRARSEAGLCRER